MKDSAVICIGTFPHRTHAEIALGALRVRGIEGWISSDDVGGTRPDVGFVTGGVKLFVRKEDAAIARRILDPEPVEQG